MILCNLQPERKYSPEQGIDLRVQLYRHMKKEEIVRVGKISERVDFFSSKINFFAVQKL